MRKKALFALVALLCCWAVDATASTLTEDEALQIVKNNRIAEGLSEWLDESNDHVGEGEVLVLNNCDVQNEYTLLATDIETSHVSRASINMNNVNALNAINCVGDNVTITLWRHANSSTYVRITSLNMNDYSEEISVEEGSQTVTVPNIHKGMYVISLIVNGNIIESKSIIK